MQPVRSHRAPMVIRAPKLGWIFCCSPHKILNNFFQSFVHCHSLSLHSHTVFTMAHENKITVDPKCVGSSTKVKVNKRQTTTSMTEYMGVLTAPKRPCNLLKSKYAPKAERKQWHSKEPKWPRYPGTSVLAHTVSL